MWISPAPTPRGYDFAELSASDLTNGELKFGLPAAIVVLILVFGALVAAFIPMSIAISSFVVIVAISSVLGQFTISCTASGLSRRC